jgi:TolB-like protein/DNA-binding winged helix-turn-helix (wHTH) protein/Tfp pilus assembly protein PilF
VATEYGPVETVRFGESFELNRDTFELRRDGRAVRLERIPFDILLMLVGRGGRLVTRDELARRIWGRNTFLDIDSSLSGAVGKIRQALRDDPESPRFIQTVPGRGYRFIAPLTKGLSHPVPLTRPTANTVPRMPPGVARGLPRRSRRMPWLIPAMSLLVVAGAVALSLHLSRVSSSPAGEQLPTLAVLPLTNLTGDPGQEYLSDGLTAKLIAALGASGPERLSVSSSHAVMPYKNTQLPVDQISRNLHAKYVLEGSVRRDGDLVRVTAQLVRADDQVRVWTEQYDHQLTSDSAMEEEIAAVISNRVHTTLTGHDTTTSVPRQASAREAAPRASAPASAPVAAPADKATELTEHGRLLVSQRTAQGLQRGAELYQQALALDPQYAPAWAALAQAYAHTAALGTGSRVEVMSQARAAAARALELDPQLAEAHVAAGTIAEHFDYNWQQADGEFRDAIGLDPRSAAAHAAYAGLLAREGLFAPALAESERALALAAEPLSPSLGIDHASVLYLAGDYAQAAQTLRRTLAVAPSEEALALLVASYAQQGRLDEALAQTRAWQDGAPSSRASATEAYLYGRADQSALAQQALLSMEEQARTEGADPLPLRALALAGLGDREQLLATLDAAYSERADFLTSLKVDPAYAALAGDARFEDLKHRIGLD